MQTARARLGLTPLERGQLALILLLLVLSAIGWAVTGDRMSGMDAGPGTDPGSLGFYVTAWVVMMAAMMFPSMAPMVLVFRRIQTDRRARGKARPGTTTLFVAGYLIAWTVFGLAAYALLETIRSVSIDALSWNKGGRYLAGAVVVGAAAYQLTPAQDVCLRHCRTPLDFVLNHWRDGYWGALRTGIDHGAWCVGCCWGLMAALFALGVMSLGWMLFVAALIAIEKLLPWKELANRGIAALLLTLGVALAFFPGQVPGLTLPDSPAAREAMMRMDGGSMSKSMKDSGPMKDQGGSMKDEGDSMKSKGDSMKDQGGAMKSKSSGKPSGGMENR
jgi:predicted metal-binding membrane protein